MSLDDGETWKVTNLSNSGDESSFEIAEPGIPDPGVAPGEGGSLIVVDDPDGATIDTAEWNARRNGGRINVQGDTNTDSRERVTIRDAVSQEELFSFNSQRTGEFQRERTASGSPLLAPGRCRWRIRPRHRGAARRG